MNITHSEERELVFDDVMLDVKDMIVDDIIKYGLNKDQNGVDHLENIMTRFTEDEDVPLHVLEADALLTFYRDVLRKDKPGAYCLYSEFGCEPFLVAKNMVDCL